MTGVQTCALPISDFRRAARLADCTLNDLVIHRLFGALRDLFARRDPLRRHRLRLFIPMDLRGNPHNQCQVGNSVGMLHIDRVVGPSVRPGDGPSDVDAPSLASVAKDMKVNRKYQMGRALIVSLEASIGLLGSPRWMLSPKYCGATCVLTNLKAPLSDSSLKGPNGRLQVGSVMLESVDLFPPVRPMTPACFGLLTYGDELRLNLRFQPATFPVDDAEYLLARLTDLLHQTVATSRDPGQVDL